MAWLVSALAWLVSALASLVSALASLVSALASLVSALASLVSALASLVSALRIHTIARPVAVVAFVVATTRPNISRDNHLASAVVADDGDLLAAPLRRLDDNQVASTRILFHGYVVTFRGLRIERLSLLPVRSGILLGTRVPEASSGQNQRCCKDCMSHSHLADSDGPKSARAG